MFGLFSYRSSKAKTDRREPRLGFGTVHAQSNGMQITQIESWGDVLNDPFPSFAGPRITAETSMRASAVYACVRLISGTIASLPLRIYKGNVLGGDRKEDFSHPYNKLLNVQPNDAMSAAVFWKYMLTAELLTGDQMAMIVREDGVNASSLLPIDPRRVSVVRRDNGRLLYIVATLKGILNIDQDDMLHIPGEGVDMQTSRGMSVIGYAAKQAIGLAMAAEEYSARFFSNNARPDIVIKYPAKVSSEETERLRVSWDNRHKSLENAHKPSVLTEGGDISQLTMSAQDSQLMEARKMQVIEIARAFGVPPVMIGEHEKTSSWGSGVEQMMLSFRSITLANHLSKISQELNRKLFMRKQFYAEHDLHMLLRGDSASQAAFYRQAIGGSNGPGWVSRNEVRRYMGLSALKGEENDKPLEWSASTRQNAVSEPVHEVDASKQGSTQSISDQSAGR